MDKWWENNEVNCLQMQDVIHVHDVHEGHMCQMDEHVHHMINVVPHKRLQHVMIEDGVVKYEIIHDQINDVLMDVIGYEYVQPQRMDERVQHMIHVVLYREQ